MNLNLIPVTPNIARVYEISKTGGHTWRMIPGETPSGKTKEADLRLVASFYGVPVEPNIVHYDMEIELIFSPDEILRTIENLKGETLYDINSRTAGNSKVLDQVNTKLPEAGKSLLKTAINRLNLGIRDVASIVSVSKTIAAMAGSTTIRLEHVAEAIQYKSL